MSLDYCLVFQVITHNNYTLNDFYTIMLTNIECVFHTIFILRCQNLRYVTRSISRFVLLNSVKFDFKIFTFVQKTSAIITSK